MITQQARFFVCLVLAFFSVSAIPQNIVDDDSLSQPSRIKTMANARSKYASYVAHLNLAGGTKCLLNKTRPATCENNDVSGSLDNEMPSRLVPPFPPVLPEQITERGEGHADSDDKGFPLMLVPASAAADGARIVEQWQELADNGEIFACTQFICNVIVSRVTKSQENQHERSLSICHVAKVNDVSGTPQNCRQVLISADDEAWILAVVGLHSGLTMILHEYGAPDFKITVLNQKALTPSRILEVVRDTLAAAPLSLEVQMFPLSFATRERCQCRGTTSIVGTAKYRMSPILKSWREIVTVRVDTWQSAPDEQKNWLVLVVSSVLLVNKYNTTRPQDFTDPNAQQLHLYLDAVRKQLKDSIATQLCRKPSWQDEFTLSCGELALKQDQY
jgi:hypothetical protein